MKRLLFISLVVLSATTAAFADGVYHAKTLEGMENALIAAGGKTVTPDQLQGKKYLFIYFSAHWCPPCRAFTPKLVEFYNSHTQKGDFDLLFISSDRSQDDMNEYMKLTAMPWTGVKLDNPKAAELKKKYGVIGIPCLVLVDENDALVASSFAGARYLGADAAIKKYLSLK